MKISEGIKETIKNCIPWRLRYFIKLEEARGKIHFSSRIKTVHDIKDYNQQLYNCMEILGITDFKDQCIAELGPGQHLSHAFLEYQLGATQEWLLDIDNLAHEENTVDAQELQLDNQYKQLTKLPLIGEKETWESYLKKINASYFTDGLYSYQNIPDDSVDVCIAFTVFQHIRKKIVHQTIEEIYRFLKPSGIVYFSIDFRDFMGELVR